MAFDYVEKNLLVLPGASSSVSIWLFATVVGVRVEIASASISLVFIPSNGIFKTILKKMRKKRKSTEKLFY